MTMNKADFDDIYSESSSIEASIKRLNLNDFRSYESLSLELDSTPVVLTGHNGAGKTNILEAVSFLAPGRGLRSAKLVDVDRVGGAPWAINANIFVGDDESFVGTGRSPDAGVRGKRIVHVNATKSCSQSELANISTIMWQTPQMDGLFLAGGSERRQFIDRIVYHFDVTHAKRVNQYEHAVRERMRLLQDGAEASWLAALELRIVSEGVAIAAARNNVIELVTSAIEQAPSCFPKAHIVMQGDVEEWLHTGKASLEAEDQYLEKLQQNRQHDMRSGRTQFGVHRSDLAVTHREKSMPAKLCSTGEQKALLLSIILAEARAKALWRNQVPILLLDEVVAHLDSERRASLFEEILAMKAQCWMTGTDALLFEELNGHAQFFEVSAGDVIKIS